jgi:tagatose 1,6-diphosphate aldolase
VLDAGEACRRLDIPLLLEILVYRREYESAEEYEAARPELVVKAVRDFVDPRFGVDIYKLEPPGSLSGVPSRATVEGQVLSDAYQALTADLTAPWVLLSAGMGKADFRRSLEYAYEHGASGYLAGRAIWAQAAAMYPDHDAIRASLRQESVPFVAELNELTDQRATAWFAHPSVDARDAFGYPVDRAFASHYPKTATPLPGTSS